MDWQRHRLLFWDDQPSFNHNERPDYRDGCLYSESNSNSYADRNTNPDRNCNADTNCNSDANSHSYGYTNCNSDINTDSYDSSDCADTSRRS